MYTCDGQQLFILSVWLTSTSKQGVLINNKSSSLRCSVEYLLLKVSINPQKNATDEFIF